MAHGNGLTTWTDLFEKVVVPLGGFITVLLAASGAWPVPVPLYPVVAGMITYPAARQYDKKRRKGTE